MRAVDGQLKNPIASEMIRMLRSCRKSDMITTAARMYGIAKKMSPTRMSTESSHPPK